MKKKITMIVTVLLLLVCLFPVKYNQKDGDTVIYWSIVRWYEVERLHQVDVVGTTETLQEGLTVRVFGNIIFRRMEEPRLAHEKDWENENGTTYFDAKILEVTETGILAECTKRGVGPMEPGTPVTFEKLYNGEPPMELGVGDEIRIMYNDRRVRIDNPLYLEIVFAVYPLEEIK